MRIMDRYLFKNFVSAYLICFISLVGLYVVIDLFSNADEFIEDHAGIIALFRRAATYYAVHSFEYFNRLSPVITQIAAMTTLASLHRNNELVALLAAGVSIRRTLAPIMMGVFMMIGLGVANRECVLPYYSEVLQRMHEDIEANQVLIPTMHIDRDQMLIRANWAHREDQRLEFVNITLPMGIVGLLQELQCENAFYRKDTETGRWGWLLSKPTAVQITRRHAKIKPMPNGDLFVYSDVSFTDMIHRPNWTTFASTSELVKELNDEGTKNPQAVRIMIHNRFMQPVLNLLLVLIGIPFVLQWERKNVYRSIAISMLLSGLFFLVDSSSGYFATHGYVDAMTAAWIPVFIFGPLSMALFQKVGA